MADYKSAYTGAQIDEAVRRVYAGFMDTTDATAVAADICSGKTAYARSAKLAGTYSPPALRTVVKTGYITASVDSGIGSLPLTSGFTTIAGYTIGIGMSPASPNNDVCAGVMDMRNNIPIPFSHGNIPLVWLDQNYNVLQDFANNFFMAIVSGGLLTFQFQRFSTGQYPTAQTLTFYVSARITGI